MCVTTPVLSLSAFYNITLHCIDFTTHSAIFLHSVRVGVNTMMKHEMFLQVVVITNFKSQRLQAVFRLA